MIGDEKTILVNEVFGNTVQGEGPNIGKPSVFLRVAACNQHCVWCDTYYTWDWQRVNKSDEVHPMTASEVIERLREAHLGYEVGKFNLVISGGEPMLQQQRLQPLLRSITRTSMFREIELETAGTIAPVPGFADYIDQFNVSLKLEHSGNPKSLRYNPKAIDMIQNTGKAVWKFVAQKSEDFAEIDEIVEEHELFPIYVMPEGIDTETIGRHALAILPEVLRRGWTLTPRLHVQMWGQERGH